MLNINRFDIKTGKPIQETIEGRLQQSIKVVEHSYLEAWLNTHGLEAQFSVGRFYESVNNADRQRLESEGRILVFTNGPDGYFTDADTAEVMAMGRGDIEPLYAAGPDSAHNNVAYGSLIASDGMASTSLANARILVIDNVARRHGPEILLDRNGSPLLEAELQQLYDKMGDGTMLVQPSVMESLITPAERDQMLARAFDKSEINPDFTTLGQDLKKTEAATMAAQRTLQRQTTQRVSQFRAATPSFPGIAKGTMSSSQWAARLGVDAIISVDDIKGDDERFSTPGLKEVSEFWVNRKSDGRYARQAVGPQVKYPIPEATRLEINPQGKEQTETLAKVVGDPVALSQYYLDQKARERERPVDYSELDDINPHPQRHDWLYDVLKVDPYNQMAGMAKVVQAQNRYVQGEWRTYATHATSVPSAMAQHHSQLKPWEVCNRDLPHGAIVAYYRSPLPNVGAVVTAINNTEIIKRQDPEAFRKQGVAYLPPSTAKDLAITDFDGDANGFFFGYKATINDLPEQLRQAVSELSLDPQYETGRSLLSQMIQNCDEGKEFRLEKAENPMAVKEFTVANAPEHRPPTIAKQAKKNHPWQVGEESHSAAVWRAWNKTAENPIGKVANAGMTLQSLALELKYAPADKQKSLLLNVSRHYQQLLRKVAAGKLAIPSDVWLVQQGFPTYGFKERIEKLANAEKRIDDLKNPQQRQKLIEKGLAYASNLLTDAANGPNAFNLQTAVDAAKSSKGIDERLHRFIKALQHKPDELRKHRKDATNYIKGQTLLTNTEEPIAWGVESVNALYQESQERLLEERRHQEYQSILPDMATAQQKSHGQEITATYNDLIGAAMDNRSLLRERRPENQQPTVKVTTSDGKRTFTLQTIYDEQGMLPIWRADGVQPHWKITISKDDRAKVVTARFPAQLSYRDEQGRSHTRPIGYVSPESALANNLDQKFRQHRTLSVSSPSVLTQVPFAQTNDGPQLFERAERYISTALTPPPGQDPQVYRTQMASGLWRHHASRHIVLKKFPEVMRDRLKQLPESRIGRLQISTAVAQDLINNSPHTIRFGRDTFQNQKGEDISVSSLSVMQPDGQRLLVGSISARFVALPKGATYMAAFSKNPTSDKVVNMQVMNLPTVEQNPTELAAFHEGRRHLTFDYEPYAAYGVRNGDIVVAQSSEGHEQIALRVKGQHEITEQLAVQATERWADVEQSAPSLLSEKLTTARSEGKALWGLNVEPLGVYNRGQITPFPVDKDRHHQWAQSIASTVKLAYDELPKMPGSPIETRYYSIRLEPESHLVLQAKNGKELARFDHRNGRVISVDGLTQIDVVRWNENREKLPHIIRAMQTNKAVSLERG